MNKNSVLSLCLTLMGWGLAAPIPTPAFQAVDCPNDVTATRCGYVAVSLNHAQPQGKQIQLFVAVQDAPYSLQPRQDALFYFAGGPGQTASLELRSLARAFDFIDVVTIDQRGIGHSRPRLNCSDDLATCGATWRAAGTDPQFFSSAQAAQDVEFVRVALRYDQINVLGASWGTRVVQALLQRNSQHLRSVILDGAMSRTHSYEQGWTKQERAINAVLEACKQDTDCRKAHPDLKSRLDKEFGQLDDQTQLALINQLSAATRSRKIGEIPSQIERVLNTKKVPSVAPQPGPSAGQLPWIEGGAHVVLNCLDSVLQTSPEQATMAWKKAGLLSALAVRLDAAAKDAQQCQALKLKQEESSAGLPFAKVPALLLGGEFDAYTAPDWQAQIAREIPGSQSVVLRGQGHLMFYTDCGVQLIKAFVLKPNQPVFRQCAQEGTVIFH